ncbi:50S ribosomal protein L24 [Candidatus Pacearchaeota archaeon]|nr:50S ribosomal protein L24 [Candidatus Pacearchaeota archaeon]|tara:strand:+ start:1311 stop:1784 length:474 start_codon:yes stop_codon:yes gene_type:complete
MKKKFSTAWKASKQPRKQRKYKANAPLHTRHKFLSANLSKALREKYGKRSLPLRKGDEVLVMRGSFKKKRAKVVSVSSKDLKVTLENIQRTKKDGTKISVNFSPSVLQIQDLILEDKERIKALNRGKKGSETKPENKEEEKETKPEKKEEKNVSKEK